MKMNSEERQILLSQLKRNYEAGEIDGDTVTQCLLKAISEARADNELNISDAWLMECSDFMVEVNSSKADLIPDHTADNWKQIQRRIAKKKTDHMLRMLKRVGCAAACITLVLTGISFVGRRVQVHSFQSQDNQVLTLEGESAPNLPAQEAQAGTVETRKEHCTTTDIDEITALLGYTPKLPTWLPDGWTPYQYDLYLTDSSEDFTAFYQKQGESKLLVYNALKLADIETLSLDFQQDGKGQSIYFEDGTMAYLSTNMGDPFLTWISRGNIYYLEGAVAEEDVVHIAQTLK